ncbi:hypothetical protein G7Y89_g9604 [Cudoniella acicularis]|uniref:EF-hand domain-containing protein n=1 Tax=Cudoniella acicularis TaxID=354080 RepID=A0A8H4REC5_9HELO|nr:hypothetical protein G7Y89_g9604 [Cudoniella acicularis]
MSTNENKPVETEDASEADIEKAFRCGDGDDDDGLSVSEASEALENLSGKSIDESDIQAACDSCGVTISDREMSLDEFKEVVRKLEEEDKAKIHSQHLII